MTPPLPPVIKAVLAVERALDSLSDEERGEALAMLFPTNTPPHVARLQMALEACRCVMHTQNKGNYPNWLICRIVDKALGGTP